MVRTALHGGPKVTQPKLRGVVTRDRLVKSLSGNSSSVKWISATPGAGKTTLAASLCAASGAEVLWYQVDAGDTDPASFFYFMGHAAERGGLAKAVSLPLMSPESANDLAAFSRHYFRALFSLLRGPTVMVIDNFQEADDPTFHTIVREAFEQVPEGVAVIVLSLTDPPPALSRLVANGVVQQIGGDELRFTRAESDSLVLSRLAIDRTRLAELHAKSAGWAAGLVLMIEHMSSARPRAVPSVDESQSAVFDYFAEAVLAKCSSDDQRALMLTAALPCVTVRLAEVMSGHFEVGRLLQRLHRRHLFVDRHGGSDPNYQYHRLFKDFLLNRAQDCLATQDLLEAAHRAALWLDLDGQAEEAVSMYLAAQDWAAAARLMAQHAPRLHASGRWRTLLDWISVLPGEVSDRNPWLTYWVGACHVWVSAPPAREALNRAFLQFAETGNRDGQILSAAALCRAIMLDFDWRPLDPWLQELEGLLRTDDAVISPNVRRIGLSRLVYLTLARNPRHPLLSAWAERLSALLSADVEPNDAVLAGFSLMFFFTWTGQTSEGEQVIRQVAPLLADARISPASQARWQWAHANHLLRAGQLDAALAMIERALEVAQTHGLTMAREIRKHRTLHLLTSGQVSAVEAALAQESTAPRLEPHHELLAWHALRRGDTASAIDEAQSALKLASDRGRGYFEMLDHLLLAQIHASAGSTDRALDQLRRFRETSLEMPGEFAAFEAARVEALIALRNGPRDASHAPLRRALDIGSRQRYRFCWGWNAASMVPLLTEALENNISVAYCHDLIRTHRLVPDSPDVENWPWPVKVRTLGRFEVQLDGVPLRFEGKSQRKPLEMLKMLISSGVRAVSIDRLIEEMWQDSDDGGRKAFDITVHRLRKLLAFDDAIEVADRHVSLSTKFVWVDAWALDRLLEPLVPVGGPPLDCQRLEIAAPKALSLFGGPFLAGDAESPWQIATRDRLTGRFQRFAQRLGKHWEDSGQWSRAGQLYQRVVELDPLAESFYRRQMVCLDALDQRAEALDLYRRCRQMLSITLGVSPSQATDAIYRDLLGR